MYYNVVNFNEDNGNTYKINIKTNKRVPLTKRDYIDNVPHYHLLKDTLKRLELLDKYYYKQSDYFKLKQNY